jgi:hypothetical protein
MRTLIWAAALCLAAAPTASRAVTVAIPYSGQITDDGQLVNGTRTLQFSLYSTPTGGTQLATQTEALSLVRGVYHTQLLFDDSVWSLAEQRWLGVTVDGGTELPRVPIGFVPFAVRALSSEPPPAGVNFPDVPGVSLSLATSSSWTRIDTVGVTVPGAGFVWVAATVNVVSQALQNDFHDVNVVLSETAPLASPFDQIRIFEAMGPNQARTLAHTQVFPATAGHHVYGLYVRQVNPLTAGRPTSFARVTLQGMWVPRRYP